MKTINKNSIASLIQKAECQESDNTITYFTIHALHVDFNHFVSDIFAQVERWDLVVEFFILHSSLEKIFKKMMGNHIEYNIMNPLTRRKNIKMLWGSIVVFSKSIDPNKILAVGTDRGAASNFETLHHNFISLGIVDLKQLKRLENLMSFR